MDNADKAEYIGQRLIERGFRDWFIYLFNLIEHRKFIVEPIHNELIQHFENIYNGNIKRCNINIAPRSAKTTLSKWFTIWTITNNPKANIIYTSYSQNLVSQIAQEIISVLESDIYKAMYPNKRIDIEDKETTAIDDFWLEYLKNETKKNTYSTKKITTYAGGTILFSAVGSQLTGFGAGIRNSNKFSGFLLLDDANKPQDIRSKVLRDKTVKYYEETLLSRLNSPDTPIINIQQRLHIEDLSGTLENKYNFKTLRLPLIDENGKCTIPSQYTKERIKELQNNNYMFQAQYQQQPIVDGGSVIKTEWFNYYPIEQSYNYKKIVISADTAISVKESADYTAFIVGGVTEQGKLHILDIIRGKWEYPELRTTLVNLYNKWQFDIYHTSASAVYVENKASGQQIIQELKKATGLPIIAVDATKDKLTRVEEILDYIASGNVLLPVSETYGNNPLLLNECQEFNREQTQTHDDLCFVAGTKIATLFGYKNIEDIKETDLIITPYGINKVLKCGYTGESEVIEKFNLKCTPSHKVYADGKFDKISKLEYDVSIDTLTLRSLLKWKYKKVLSSTVLNTDLWGRKGIIYLNQLPMRADDTLKDFTLQFGNIIAEKQFQKAILFTTKMVIALITTIAIWSVFHVSNILHFIEKKLSHVEKVKKVLSILKKYEKKQRLGINQKKVERGTENTLKIHLQKHTHTEKKKPAKYAEKSIQLKQDIQNIVVNNAEQKPIILEKKVDVYNLTVDKAGVYYANDVLVSNCDALVHLINNTIAKRRTSILEVL